MAEKADLDETIPDSLAGSPDKSNATWAVRSPIKNARRRPSFYHERGDEHSTAAASVAGPSRLAGSGPFRDPSPVDLDSPATRRRKVESRKSVRGRMLLGEMRSRNKRPISLSPVPLMSGMPPRKRARRESGRV